MCEDVCLCTDTYVYTAFSQGGGGAARVFLHLEAFPFPLLDILPLFIKMSIINIQIFVFQVYQGLNLKITYT